jgi:NitT/TauT family transport system permease protein
VIAFPLHSNRLQEALRAPAAVGIELLILGAIASIFFALVTMTHQWVAPLQTAVTINLSFWALPKYTLMSLARGFAAYILSLGFTLIYGTIAAHNHRAEKIMLPTLDVLQAIPVLGFLPGLVLALVKLFPTREIGLELACVIMIFTGQVWNMTFSFHGSLRGIPATLREAAAMQRFTGWQTFRFLEFPASMIGLVWNSMMSMAGGWFFLTVNEAFTLRDHDYRLPGIGSYMNEAINHGNTPAMIAAIIAMIVMIVVVDQLFWRPIVVWSERFKLEDQPGATAPRSWFLELLKKSVMMKAAAKYFAQRRSHRRAPGQARVHAPISQDQPLSRALSIGLRIGRAILLILLAVALLWAAFELVRLLFSLPLYKPASHDHWIGVLLALLASFARTSVAVLIAAAWALPVGILIGRSPVWSQRLQPFVQVAASFPAPMLFPLVALLLVWLHVPFTIGCIALMLLGSQWYILFNVIAGATAIPADLTEAANVYRLSAYQRWIRLYLPSVFPYLVTGLVTAAGGAWNATIVSEYLQIKDETKIAFGLGSLISHATAAGNFPLLAASVLTMAVAVVLLNRFIWKRLYRMAEAKYSLNV